MTGIGNAIELPELNSNNDIWQAALEVIKENINPRSYQTWFAPLQIRDLTDKAIQLEVPSKFFCEWIENHYQETIRNALIQVTGHSFKIGYKVRESEESPSPYSEPVSEEAPKPRIEVTSSFNSNLNSHYTFDNYIVGDSNRFAHAAAWAVAKAPGETNYNPLIVYGGTGLGKTHLVQAIGNYVNAQNPALKVYYTSSENFTRHFITSIQENKALEFSNFYRSCDVLLIDDIHFFNNKGKTQEEFFHTFNALHQNKKQIVLTSDRPITELSFLEERLVSRFKWGLVADIQPPDLETRIAILEKKCNDNGLSIPNEVVEFMAVNLIHNVRELEGALTRLMAQVLLTHSEPTLELARKVVAQFGTPIENRLNTEQIIKMTAKSFGVPEESFMKKNRKKQIALARQVAMYLAVELTNLSTVTVGLHFGGRDHSTVIYAHKMIQERMQDDEVLQRKVIELRKRLEYSN
jgi:chromosomal replication initiator protein